MPRAIAHLGEPTSEMCERLHRAHLLRERGDLYRQPLLLLVIHSSSLKKERPLRLS